MVYNINMKNNEREVEYGIPYEEAIDEQGYKLIFDDAVKDMIKDVYANDAVADSVYDYLKKAYEDNAGTRLESMYLLDGTNGELLAAIDKPEEKIPDGIIYTDEFEEAIEEANNSGIPTIAIHNHPSGYPPSPNDFMKAYDNYYEDALVIGHNGQIYRYSNHEVYLNEDACNGIQDLISEGYYRGLDVDRAFTEVYNEIDLSYEILKGGHQDE